MLILFVTDILTVYIKCRFGLFVRLALIPPASFALLGFPKSLGPECSLSRTMSLVMPSGHRVTDYYGLQKYYSMRTLNPTSVLHAL